MGYVVFGGAYRQPPLTRGDRFGHPAVVLSFEAVREKPSLEVRSGESLLFWLGLLFVSALAACVQLPVSAGQKKTSVSGCTDGPPVYCADTGIERRDESPLAPPQVSQVFRDPDFGSRMVRVTDANGSSGKFAGFSFGTNSAGEANEWSKFDPRLGEHGGYHFYVMHSGGGALLFTLDATTLQVVPFCGRLPGCQLPAAGSFSYADPNVIFGHFESSNKVIAAYDLSSGKRFRVYDFDKCPGVPKIEGDYPGAVTNSGDDSKFASYAGGKMQGFGTLVTYYDRTAERCYWYDTANGTTGGTDMPETSADAELLPSPTVPSLRPTGGDLPPGDYYVRLTVSTQMNPSPGETTPSPEAHIRLTSAGGIAIAAPAIDNRYRLVIAGYSVYIGTAPGAETRQAALQPLREDYVQASRLAEGPSPPSENRAGYNVHAAWLSRDGKTVRVAYQQGGTNFIWTPGSTHLSACIMGPPQGGVAGYCGGHLALGYSHMVNHGGPGSNTSLLLRPLSDMNHLTQLISPETYPLPTDEDSHWSWNNADPADTAPVCGAFYQGSGQVSGDGTQNVATNPLLAIKHAWDREIVCVATAGPSRVWRFAHHRSTGACNDNDRGGSCFGAIAIGNVSQDGKFYLFGSDWEWTLGNAQGSGGCPSTGRCRTDAFIVELK
jgi:hypothetical protein